MLRLKKIRSDLDREPPRDLRHRLEQRKLSVRALDGFIGDAEDFFLQQLLREFGTGSEVEVGKERLPFAQERIFGWQRLFDLQNQIGRSPNFRGVGDERSTGGAILRIGETGGDSRRLLHHHFGAE